MADIGHDRYALRGCAGQEGEYQGEYDKVGE